VQKVEKKWPSEPVKLVLGVQGVQDPGNLGALLRTAEAAGVSGVFLTEGCCDPFNPKAVRAAMGSLFRLNLQNDISWREALTWLVDRKVPSMALMPRAEKNIFDLGKGPMALWVGSEGDGLAEELAVACEGKVRIPMAGPVESLNVGAAAAIALFYKGFQGPVP